jgi:acyl-CoA reductase-like NAD-dependent aldehyde dehydrogenase
MKKIDVWSCIRPNDNSFWLKIPYWAIILLRKLNICDSELYVLLYLFSKVEDNIKEVYAPTQLGVGFCNINKFTYFKAIRKFKFMGLNKIGNGVYDISKFLEFMKQQDVNLNNVDTRE